MCRGAVGMKVGRSVIALENGDGTTGSEQPAENRRVAALLINRGMTGDPSDTRPVDF
jgi:hypothetical protein